MALIPPTICFLGKLSGPHMALILALILLIPFLAYRVRKLPEEMKEMERLFREMGEALGEMMARRAREKSAVPEEEERFLRKCDVIAVTVLVVIVALFFGAMLPSS